jgi:hypothetical protein
MMVMYALEAQGKWFVLAIHRFSGKARHTVPRPEGGLTTSAEP